MAFEYEVGQRVQMLVDEVSFSPGTPPATEQYEWALITGDPDSITMSEVDAEANIVSGATAVAYEPTAESAVRGAKKAVNPQSGQTVRFWYPQVNFRTYQNVFTDDFSSYQNDAELQAAWSKITGTGDLFTLVNDAATPSGKAALLDSQSTALSYYKWVAPSDRPNNGDFKLYMEIYSDRGANPNDPRDIWVEGRGSGSVQVRYDETLMPTFDYYSILWDLSGGLLLHKIWLKGDAEPTEWTSVSVPVQTGDVRIVSRFAGDRRIGYASIAFNGEEPVRPA